VRRSTQPFRVIEDGLVDVERGAFHTRLPSLAGAEAGKIALAFNRMAGAIEDNLNARAEAADARRRLEQSRELADVVQARIEDERAHIARELHDETGQSVTAIRSLALSLARRETDGDSARFLIESPRALAPFIAAKGSVALNGVSLTVNDDDDARFGVNIIPYTLAHTTWGDLGPGDLVNLEVDLLARYVARLTEQGGASRESG